MGWSLSPFVFQKLADVFVNKLPDRESPTAIGNTSKAEKRWIRRRRRLTRAMLLLFMEDFAIFAKSFDVVMELKEVTFALFNDIGLLMHPTKGYHTAARAGDHLIRITLDQGF